MKKCFLLNLTNILKVFGCACYPLLRPCNQHKFDFHSSLCLFLGYNDKQRGYICLTSTGKMVISRNVLFNESLFPFFLPNNPFIHNGTSTDIFVSSTAPITIVSSSHESTSVAITTSPRLSVSPLPLVSSPTTTISPPPVPTTNALPMLTHAKTGIFKPKLFHTSVLMIFLNHLLINKLWLNLIGFVPCNLSMMLSYKTTLGH